MHRHRRWSIAAVAIAICFLNAAASAPAQVLKQVPSDAMVVIKVSNLQATSGKVAAFAQQLGIAQMVPQLADPLAWATEESQISKGINKDGEMAIVVLDPGAGGNRGAPPIVALIPVSDYAAFLTNFADAKAEGDISEVTLPNSGSDKGYISKWGDYAALTPTKALLSRKTETPLTTPMLAGKELESKDAVVYLNMAAIRAKALPELQRNRTKAINEITRGMSRNKQNQRFVPVVKALVNQALNVAEGFLQNTEAASFGISFAEGGIKTTTLAEFKAGTYPAELVAGIKNTDADLMAGLPAGNYLFYGGMAWNPATMSKAFADLTDPIVKELATAGDDMKPIQKYIDSIKELLGAVEMSNFGMVAPTGQLGQESLFQSVGVMTGDSKKINAAMKGMFETQGEFTKLTTPGMQVQTTYAANAKTVDGVAFDQFKTTFNAAGAKTAQEMQVAQMMSMLYGPDGMNALSGVVDDKHVLMVAGGNDALLTSAIASAKGNQSNLAKQPHIMAVSSNLPANRFLAWYLPVDAMVATGVTYAKQFGMPVNIAIPPNLPPIGVTGSTEGTAVRIDGYIPSQLVQSLVAAGMQMFMAVQGGGQPGGPGGL